MFPRLFLNMMASSMFVRLCRLALLQWQKRRKFGGKRCYISRLAPQSESVPLFVVPKAAAVHTWDALDSRGVFIIEIPGMSHWILPERTCVWPPLRLFQCHLVLRIVFVFFLGVPACNSLRMPGLITQDCRSII